MSTQQLPDLQSSNWFVDIPGYDDLTLKVHKFQIPSVEVGRTVIPSNTDMVFSGGGDHIYFDDLEFDFFVDEDMGNYLKLLKWMKSNVKNNQAEMTSVFCHILDNKRQFQGVELEFQEAFPIKLSNIDLDTDSSTNNVLCTVTFRYYNMDVITD